MGLRIMLTIGVRDWVTRVPGCIVPTRTEALQNSSKTPRTRGSGPCLRCATRVSLNHFNIFCRSPHRVCPLPCLPLIVSVPHRVCASPCLSLTVSVPHRVGPSPYVSLTVCRPQPCGSLTVCVPHDGPETLQKPLGHEGRDRVCGALGGVSLKRF